MKAAAPLETLGPEALEALEAVLPEDAPAGHAAWERVVLDSAGKRSKFRVGPHSFQATLGCCLTEAATLRVARALFVKASSGESKERVGEFRDEVYARIRGIRGARGGDGPAAPPVGIVGAAGAGGGAGAGVGPLGAAPSGSPPGRSPQARPDGQQGAPVRGPSDSPPGDVPVARPAGSPLVRGASAAPPAATGEDAPEGHEAWGKTWYERRKGVVCLSLGALGVRRADGSPVWFQTTVSACGGSVEEAQRVARLCYLRFAEGAGPEEVKAYRKALYGALRGAAAGPAAPAGEAAARRGKRRAARALGAEGGAAEQKRRFQDGALKEKRARLDEGAPGATRSGWLRTQGCPEGSLLVEGRSPGKKNASINGVYARRAEGFGGHWAYEKVGSATAPRFLYYWAEKSRWKIDSRLPSDKGGFAYLKVAGVRSPALVGPGHQWHVCDGSNQAGGHGQRDEAGARRR
ncbi:unnamed protein product [Prorocentrum cordatum]|uniref:AP2/ERF domain-containing protein n=1 Tax=Prorocentrum cordatum TaxID=2364126 RepID=A0ABN9U2B1_9DINO|nr:unnamed protein product [Polarella glacialis]